MSAVAQISLQLFQRPEQYKPSVIPIKKTIILLSPNASLLLVLADRQRGKLPRSHPQFHQQIGHIFNQHRKIKIEQPLQLNCHRVQKVAGQ